MPIRSAAAFAPGRRQCMGLALAGLLGASPRAWALGEAELAGGLRAAIERGIGMAIDQLGRPDGFLGNAKVRIPLPGALEKAGKLLGRLGQGESVEALRTAMNRAAEQAVPASRELLQDAARSLSLDDARALLRGGDTAVTLFFARKTRVPLGERFLPLISAETAKVDLAAKYNAVAAQAAQFGLLKPEDASVERHVTGKALDGLYLLIGEEEKRIRRDPVGTGSALLRQVFGKR